MLNCFRVCLRNTAIMRECILILKKKLLKKCLLLHQRFEGRSQLTVATKSHVMHSKVEKVCERDALLKLSLQHRPLKGVQVCLSTLQFSQSGFCFKHSSEPWKMKFPYLIFFLQLHSFLIFQSSLLFSFSIFTLVHASF